MHIESARLQLAPLTDGRFRIIDRHHRRPLGTISLRAARHSTARGLELSYCIDSAHRRRGFCSEAAHALVEHAFLRGATGRIYASTAWSNIASRRVLVGLGMAQRDIAALDWESVADELPAGNPLDYPADLTPYARVEYEIHRADWLARRSALGDAHLA